MTSDTVPDVAIERFGLPTVRLIRTVTSFCISEPFTPPPPSAPRLLCPLDVHSPTTNSQTQIIVELGVNDCAQARNCSIER